MKLLFIGDPHFKVNNIPDVELFIERVEQLAKTQQPDIICIGGDLLDKHERLHTIPLNKAYNFVNRMRQITLTYVLVGNHDMISNRQYLAVEGHWMNGMKEWENVVIVDTVKYLDVNGYHFVFCPYVEPGRFIEALNTCETDWKTADCIFAHQEFYGCKMGAIVSVEGDKWSDEYPPVVSGHIHAKQTIGNVYYTGSAMQHAFGESEQNIIAILEWNKPNTLYKLTEHDLKLPRKKIVYADVDNIDEFKLPETKDKIKVTISGNYDEFKAFKRSKKYKELIDSGTKVIFKATREQIKKDKESIEQMEKIDTSDFNFILHTLINKEKNPYLLQAHELVVKNKEIDTNDVFYV